MAAWGSDLYLFAGPPFPPLPHPHPPWLPQTFGSYVAGFDGPSYSAPPPTPTRRTVPHRNTPCRTPRHTPGSDQAYYNDLYVIHLEAPSLKYLTAAYLLAHAIDYDEEDVDVEEEDDD